MKNVLLSIAAVSLLGAPAFADDIFTFQTSEDFQEILEEEYGERELDRLSDEIRDDITRELGNAGISPARIDVTILDAKPNRPTLEQIGRNGLRFRSFGIGGMDLKAVAFDGSGNVINELEYGWFENDIRLAEGRTTWYDARRASDKFARKFAKQFKG